jgi:hypothetical protein
MSTSRILTRLIFWDMRVQARENVYLFTILTTLTFGGVLLVATANSMNHFIARAFPVSVVLYLAFLAHFDVVKSIWAWILFGLNPGHAMLRSLLWAADPSNVSTTEAIYAFGYMGLLVAVFFVWALRLYGDNIARSAT